MTLTDAAAQVIQLAREINAYYAAEWPKLYPDYPRVSLRGPVPKPPPARAQLEALLRSLQEDQVYRLLLLMYLGRGDFDTYDLKAAYAYLKETFQEPEHAISQLLEKVPLPDYLADGLDALRNQGLDPEHLFADQPAARSQAGR